VKHKPQKKGGIKFTFDVSEEQKDNNGDGKTGPPAVFLSALEDIALVRKDFMNFDINENKMAYLSGNDNEVYTVQ
jgi:hypothetical protein